MAQIRHPWNIRTARDQARTRQSFPQAPAWASSPSACSTPPPGTARVLPRPQGPVCRLRRAPSERAAAGRHPRPRRGLGYRRPTTAGERPPGPGIPPRPSPRWSRARRPGVRWSSRVRSFPIPRAGSWRVAGRRAPRWAGRRVRGSCAAATGKVPTHPDGRQGWRRSLAQDHQRVGVIHERRRPCCSTCSSPPVSPDLSHEPFRRRLAPTAPPAWRHRQLLECANTR